MKNTMNIGDFFETSDIGLAAALLTLCLSLDSLDKRDPRRTNFIFKRVKGLDDTIQAYWSRELKVDPVSLLANLKYLKNRLYANT